MRVSFRHEEGLDPLQATRRDRRSIGRAKEVVAEVLANPERFGALFAGLFTADPVVRARAADAVEKISAIHPEYLRPYRAHLLGDLARCDQNEVRWHIAQILPRLRWNRRQQRQVYDLLQQYLRGRSSIVKTFAMQALADLAQQRPALRPVVLRQVRALSAHGTPAMRARGRKLLPALSRARWLGQLSIALRATPRESSFQSMALGIHY